MHIRRIHIHFPLVRDARGSRNFPLIPLIIIEKNSPGITDEAGKRVTLATPGAKEM
jgi:hypothetical protein